VELLLLESSDAAALSLRGGVRRLIHIAHRQQISSFSAKFPRPLSSKSGLAARGVDEAFRAAFLERLVDEAYELLDLTKLPRTKAEFDARLASGAGRLGAVYTQYATALQAARVELDKVTASMASAGKHPGATAALTDLRNQLALMLPDDLMAHVPFSVLQQFPRYFRAMPLRLGRAITDPRKDASKLEPVLPLWAAFTKKRAASKTPNALGWHALRWEFEELRVAIFAPELKTPYPVTASKISTALAALV
jgi:ATP-dependent helicase HrpA